MIDREKVIRHITAEICIAKVCKKDFASVDIDMLSDALTLLKDQESVIEALKSDLDETLAVLSEQPEIVRCRDCKYWRTNTEFCIRWSVANVARHTPPDWFCANGERAETARSSSEIPNS